MTQPHIDDAAALRVQAGIMALGGLLDDVTRGQTPYDVHRALLDRLSIPGHDPRVSGVLTNRWDFLAGWEALQDGTDLPATVWEGLVLPTIVAFSSAQAAKMNLELATNHWLAARAAVDEVPEYPLVIAAVLARDAAPGEPVTDHDLPAPVATLFAAAPTGPIDDPAAAGRMGSRPWLIRSLVPSAAAVAIAATAAIMLHDGSSPAEGRPQLSPVTQPSGPRLSPATGGPLASASPSVSPAGTQPPAAGSPAGSVAPAPPDGLTVIGRTATSISLSWQPPAAGAGAVAYYRIFQDGVAAGWTSGPSAVVFGLAPQTEYTFVVTAVDGSGHESGPSAAVIAATADAGEAPAPSAQPSDPAGPSADPRPSNAGRPSQTQPTIPTPRNPQKGAVSTPS